MQRDTRAYLKDILEAAAAIHEAVKSLKEETYGESRLIRSSVEREFIIIGEALKVVAHQDPEMFSSIPEGRQIIDFRNLLSHEYLRIDNRIVWGAIQTDLPLLEQRCGELLESRRGL